MEDFFLGDEDIDGVTGKEVKGLCFHDFNNDVVVVWFIIYMGNTN